MQRSANAICQLLFVVYLKCTSPTHDRAFYSNQIKLNWVLLTCDQKLTNSQFKPTHATNKKDNEKTKQKKPLSSTESCCFLALKCVLDQRRMSGANVFFGVKLNF